MEENQSKPSEYFLTGGLILAVLNVILGIGVFSGLIEYEYMGVFILLIVIIHVPMMIYGKSLQKIEALESITINDYNRKFVPELYMKHDVDYLGVKYFKGDFFDPYSVEYHVLKQLIMDRIVTTK